jgi:hypothetical protein
LGAFSRARFFSLAPCAGSTEGSFISKKNSCPIGEGLASYDEDVGMDEAQHIGTYADYR